MCDNCTEVLSIFANYENDTKDGNLRCLKKFEVLVLCQYVHNWSQTQRQCTCCYKEQKNFERFNAVLQGVLLTVLHSCTKLCGREADWPQIKASKEEGEDSEEEWTLDERERLFSFSSKIFLLNFPLYMAFKHSVHCKLEEVTADEVSTLASFCDVNDLDIPIYLLRNVCFFCQRQGLSLFRCCFEETKISHTLPLQLGHAITTVISSLKLWMNIHAIIQHLVPLRSAIVRYLCRVPESELRVPSNRNLFEYMWTTVKDPLDSQSTLDQEGLDLAFKYFSSSTLTMRLAGIAQINSHINLCTELCHPGEPSGESVSEKAVGGALAQWLIDKRIVEYIFGPNLHVEIIKQSQVVLAYLALEGRITNRHIDAIWAAAQLKHCARQVMDLLPPLIKNLEVGPASYLYSLLQALEPRDHNEQTLLLASALIKFLWTNGGAGGMAPADLPDSLPNPFIIKPLAYPRTNLSSQKEEEDEDEEEEGEEDEEEEEEEEEGSTSGSSSSSAKKDNPQSDEEKVVRTHLEGNCAMEDERFIEASREQLLTGSECPKKSKDEMERRVPLLGESAGSADDEEDGDDERKRRSTKRRSRNSSRRSKRFRDQATSEDSGDELSVSLRRTHPKKSRKSTTSGDDSCKDELSVLGPGDDTSPQYLMQPMEASSDPCLSRDSGSSSRLSNKSEKNMADFEGEEEEDESECDEELVQLAQSSANSARLRLGDASGLYDRKDGLNQCFQVDNVCETGRTLLWDLLQDEKILQLGEGLALEAEKILCNLVCWSNPRLIRMKFIEGCLHNLAKNKSVLVSLRILPKLFSSFQQYRGSSDAHSVTLWADKEHQMMKHFFGNLVTYVSRRNDGLPQGMYSHTEEIQVRLNFLSRIFSTSGSPEAFRLSREQVDALWCCLATDPECSDELFSWLLNQARSPDQHALGLELFEHILLEKMPQLPPETISMTALALLQQLSSVARLAVASFDTPSSEADVCGIRQLWGIALKAHSTDVSMAAIQNLNNYYINIHHGTLEKEEEFIEQCMERLHQASRDIGQAEESNLTVIQRALLLLKTHMETFAKRYAYHLRRWQLEQGGGADIGGGHRARWAGEKPSTTLKIICQPAGVSEKRTIELRSCDYIADLRAEVTVWWERSKKGEGVLGEGPIRMITQGQELVTDLDEKSLAEMGFKDLQLVFVSIGATRPGRRRGDGLEPTSLLEPPPRERLPTTLLLKSAHFERLFELMQQLGSLKAINRAGIPVVHTKAQVLSRRVWEILMMLPTSPSLLTSLCHLPKPSALQAALNPESPQKLMYALQIVEALRLNSLHNEENAEGEDWAQKFVDHGGLRHLFDIFMSGVLQAREGETWSEWHQDCLASLLKLLYLFGIRGDAEDELEKKNKRMRRSSTDKLTVPKLNQNMLSMMSEVESVLKVILVILYEASFPSDPNQYRTGFWGRSQVVHCAITLLVSWVFCQPQVKDCFFRYPSLDAWLKRLVLEDPEPAVRREVCTGLYRLCLSSPNSASTVDSGSGNGFVAPLLSILMQFLSVAQNMRPTMSEEEEKEPYGPGCKDYFWLLCRLVDSMETEEGDESDPLHLDSLARHLARAIRERDYRETRHHTVEDDGLRGLLSLAQVVLKKRPAFKFSKEGKDLLLTVFECLFSLPCPEKRFLPKCKSNPVRSAAFDLLVELVKGCHDNYVCLHQKLLEQHSPSSHSNPYPWDYWPQEDGRSECGYVGLTNLGATCYLASCMQHLYMMTPARHAVLSALATTDSKHFNTLGELQRMFAYLLESERKAYNPRSFCRVYTMDHQPLNTGEQKDMAEFFTDLISKLEEMTLPLKDLVKNLFCGMISNNVVSLDCPHISRTLEEFYTLRCQVADMRNLYESLDELTVKDTLEGDNMYTCSQCGKKVRAEKRACINKLPRILAFNTMRYTFNMATMTKEKVNTHFSFPPRLDMAPYMEGNLISRGKEDLSTEKECYEYELVGVTVHTGTADGGHYYSFIRERQNAPGVPDKWLLFNDAEVKPFDPAHIAAECFGGEMTSKTYDSVTDKFLDFSFEKTNSAYMLFYERLSGKDDALSGGEASGVSNSSPEGRTPATPTPTPPADTFELSRELAEWIWQDNMQFLQDCNFFEHTYFNFMWQICGYIPQTLAKENSEIMLLSAKLGTSFVLETLIHAKEKPTIAQWIELLTKQFNSSQAACQWFLDEMALNDWWPVQILLKCPNQVVRQLFQRLCIHVINQLRHAPGQEKSSSNDLSGPSCITRFIQRLLGLMEQGAKPHLTEYFALLLEFAKMGEEESGYLLTSNAISAIVAFYLGQKSSQPHEFVSVEVASDEEDEEEEEEGAGGGGDRGNGGGGGKYKAASLEKMITLVALLVEKSRNTEDHRLQLAPQDMTALTSGKGFPFLYQQIRDNINMRQTAHLILSLCRFNEHLAVLIVNMIFTAITKQPEASGPFFKALSLLLELSSSSSASGVPPIAVLVLQRIWETAEFCPQQCLEWLTLQAPRHKAVHSWLLQGMDNWVERFLLAHAVQRVRYVTALVLVSLVPSNHFRQAFRSTRSLLVPQKEVPHMSQEALLVMHQIFNLLLRLLKRAKLYVGGIEGCGLEPTRSSGNLPLAPHHGTTKLMSYFALMTYCLISKTEKLMFTPFFLDLWNLFQPKLSEPAIPVHHNKQALLIFWYQVCSDCPENIQLIVQSPHISKNIAFNYILADHDDQEVVVFNRCMLPAYYGLLRLCCQQSPPFTRQLANHQNIQWAFKNITPYTTQYTAAINELFKLMRLFVNKYPDSTESELREIQHFKCTTLQLYLSVLDARSCWATLINALRILMETHEDRLLVVCNGGLYSLCQAFHGLHLMYHEATACHVTVDLVELLTMVLELLKCARAAATGGGEVHQWVLGWKDRAETVHKLLTLLNAYTPPEVRHVCLEVLQELGLLYPENTLALVVPLLANCHAVLQENQGPMTPAGPYFPHPGKGSTTKSSLRPQRPMLQMVLHPTQVQVPKGVDEVYDQALLEFFLPYHRFVDMLCRLAVSHHLVTPEIVNLSAMLAIEGVPLQLSIFPKLWLDIYHSEVGQTFLERLLASNYLADYMEAVLMDERCSLNDPLVHQFFTIFMSKIGGQVVNEQVMQLVLSLVATLVNPDPQRLMRFPLPASVPSSSSSTASTSLASSRMGHTAMQHLEQQARKLIGDLRALALIFSVEKAPPLPEEFLQVIGSLMEVTPPANPDENDPEPIVSETRSEADETSAVVPWAPMVSQAAATLWRVVHS